MKPERVCEIYLRFQPPNIITTHPHSSKTITRFPFYSPSFSQLPRLIILFLLKKLVKTNILKIELKIMSREKKETSIIRVHLLKRRRRRRLFSTSSHFPPKQLHLDLHFLSIDIKVLLYHGPRPLFMHALPFPWLVNYDRIS
jgi:hypothetical protein